MIDSDFFWLVGLLEGEGSFFKGPPSKPLSCAISLQMTDEDVVRRVADLFQVSMIKHRPRKAHYKESFCLLLRGRRAYEFMKCLLPYMGVRRRARIQEVVDGYFEVTESRRQQSVTRLEAIQRMLAEGLHTHAHIGKTVGVDRATVSHIARGSRMPKHQRFRSPMATVDLDAANRIDIVTPIMDSQRHRHTISVSDAEVSRGPRGGVAVCGTACEGFNSLTTPLDARGTTGTTTGIGDAGSAC